MTKPMTRIHNTETNEVIDREMTDDEFAEYKKMQANYEIVKADAKTQAAAKTAAQAKLAVLGLTVEDLQALGL